jgi:hypothetical protein
MSCCESRKEERNAKIKHFLRLKQEGIHFNQRLVQSKAFNNPNLYAKLVEYLDLDDSGTNDPHAWKIEPSEDAFYDQRYRIQVERINQNKRKK